MKREKTTEDFRKEIEKIYNELFPYGTSEIAFRRFAFDIMAQNRELIYQIQKTFLAQDDLNRSVGQSLGTIERAITAISKQNINHEVTPKGNQNNMYRRFLNLPDL